MRRWVKVASGVLGALVLIAVIAGIVGPQTKPASTAAPTSSTTTSSAASSSAAPSSELAPAPVSTPPDSSPPVAAPAALTCGDVGGVFVKHGTDGRGDCEPADPRAHCHVPPAQQDGNYLAELTMTPPFPDGTIDSPFLIGMASNADCWKAPAR